MTRVKAKVNQKYFESLFKNDRNTADTWKCINQLLRKTKPKTTLPQTIETKGKLITSPKNICKEINKHSVESDKKLAANPVILAFIRVNITSHFSANETYHQLSYNQLIFTWQGLREGGSGGTLYLGPGLEGPGLKGPGRVQVSALSFGIAP